MTEDSPTAYAILGLLAARPWSARELVWHIKTSSNLRHLWPRAESKLYEAPKILVACGRATSRERVIHGRRRAEYRITAKGRRALQRWLDEPGSGLNVEFDDGLRVAFATAGTLEQLRSSLARMRAEQRARAEALAKGLEWILEQDFTIPERAHTSALLLGLVQRIGIAVTEWTTWADDVTADWDTVALDANKAEWARDRYRTTLREVRAFLEVEADDET